MESPQLSGSTSTPTAHSDSVPPTSSDVLDAKITIKIPGWVDERCFTYCTQRSNARTFQVEPVCHTLCWRKVYRYEQRIMNTLFVPEPVPVKYVFTGPQPIEDRERELPHRINEQAAQLGRLSDLYLPEKLARLNRMTDAMTRRTAQITALRPELEAHFVQIEKMNRGEVDSETARRIRKEAKEFLQRMDRLAEIPSHYPRIRSASDFILPFPLPGTDNWSFLRGHYIIYARGTQKPGEHWGTMRTLFLTEGWDAVQALIRQGREVGAVLDSNMLPKKDGPKTVGLEQLPALAGREAEKKLDPNYMAIISLEHVPHVIFDSVCGSVQRISSRLTSFLQRYRESFASGQQWRTAGALWQTALDPVDGPLGTLKRVGEALDNRRKERQREEQAVREKEKRGGAAP